MSLTWSDTAQDETGFEVQRCTGGGCTNFANLTTLPANSTAYSDSGLTASTTYLYRVRSVRNGDLSSWSEPASATTQAAPAGSVPTTPTGLTANAATSSAVNLAWSDTSTDETGFAVERCSGAGCSRFTEVATVSAGVTTLPDAGLTPGTSYSYRVRAFNAAASSGYSNTASATTQPAGTVPSAPTALTATATSSTRVLLAWTVSSTDETDFTFNGARVSNAHRAPDVGDRRSDARTRTTGLARSTAYRYRVQALQRRRLLRLLVDDRQSRPCAR